MSEAKKPNEETKTCQACKRAVPSSTTRSREANDYTYYFCGAGCEQRWLQERHNPEHVNKSE